MESRQVLAAVLVLAVTTGAAAHGGTLHEWPSTPSGSNYLRTKVASCSDWLPGSGRVVYSLTNGSAIPRTPAINVKGDATIWQYLYGNCSVPAGSPPSAGVEFNVTITRNGRPVEGLTVDGIATTGTCGATSATPYYLNLTASPLDDDHNLLWFHNFTTNSTGRVHGNGANDGPVMTSGDNAARSLVIVNTETAEALACCDLTPAGPATTNWAAALQGKGKECEEEAHGAHSKAAAADSHDAHDGHDHDDHDGHDHGTMSNSSSTTPAPARSGASAGGVAGGVMAAAALAAAVFAVL